MQRYDATCDESNQSGKESPKLEGLEIHHGVCRDIPKSTSVRGLFYKTSVLKVTIKEHSA